jgi:hypothetical protein
MSSSPENQTTDGGESSRRGPPDVTDNAKPETGPASTDAARGQTHEMARTGGDASVDNRGSTPFEPATSSLGSRTGSTIGSQSARTGLGDGEPSGSSQGLAIERRPDDDPERPAK